MIRFNRIGSCFWCHRLSANSPVILVLVGILIHDTIVLCAKQFQQIDKRGGFREFAGSWWRIFCPRVAGIHWRIRGAKWMMEMLFCDFCYVLSSWKFVPCRAKQT